MPKDTTEVVDKPAVPAAAIPPMLVIGLGRGKAGKSTCLALLAWRAYAQGRSVRIADGDPRSHTLSTLFPEASRPATEEMADGKAWLRGEFNAAIKERRSLLVDLGAGDRLLQEFGRELRLAEFCRRVRYLSVALYVLGPDAEDIEHVAALNGSDAYPADVTLLVFNAGVIALGRTVRGAFDRALADPRIGSMIEAGAVPLMLPALPLMEEAKAVPGGLYVAGGESGGFDPIEAFMVQDYLEQLEGEFAALGLLGRLP